MDLTARLRASALVEAITEPGETFPAGAARELIGITPLNSRAGAAIRLEVRTQGPSSAIEGAAAGGGTVWAAREEDERRWSLGEPVTWRCGWYKLDHEPGRLTISQVFDGTHEDETGRACRLFYDRRSGEPERLDLQVQHAAKLGSFRFALARFRPWKRPA